MASSSGISSTQSYAQSSSQPEAAPGGGHFDSRAAAALLTTSTTSTGDAALFPVVFLVAGCVVVTLLVVLAVAYVFRETSFKPKSVEVFLEKEDCDIVAAAAQSNSAVAMSVYDVDAVPASGASSGCRKSGRQHQQHQRWRRDHTFVTGLYFAFWGIYSVVFTFTAVSLMVAALAGSGPGRKLWTSTLSSSKDDGGLTDSITMAVRVASVNVSRQVADSVSRYRLDETERIERAVAGARRACSDVYVGELFADVAAQMDRAIAASGEGTMPLETVSGVVGVARDTVGGMTLRRARILIDAYRSRVEAFSSAYRRNVSVAISGTVTAYQKYLRKTMNGDWTAFPRRLFNDSAPTSGPRGATLGSKMLGSAAGGVNQASGQQASSITDELLGEEADFGAFMEIEEVENVRLWPQQFWERQDN